MTHFVILPIQKQFLVGSRCVTVLVISSPLATVTKRFSMK